MDSLGLLILTIFTTGSLVKLDFLVLPASRTVGRVYDPISYDKKTSNETIDAKLYLSFFSEIVAFIELNTVLYYKVFFWCVGAICKYYYSLLFF